MVIVVGSVATGGGMGRSGMGELEEDGSTEY